VTDYNGSPYGIRNVFQVVAKELRWEVRRSPASLPSLALTHGHAPDPQGFIILNHLTPEVLNEFYTEIPPAIASGSIPVKEHIFKGLDNVRPFPGTFSSLLLLTPSRSIHPGRVVPDAVRPEELELWQGAPQVAAPPAACRRD